MDILPFFDRKLIGGKFKVRGDDCNLNFFSVFRRFVSLLARHVLAKVPPKSNACSNNHCADYPPPCIVVIHSATPPPNSLLSFIRNCNRAASEDSIHKILRNFSRKNVKDCLGGKS